MIAPDRENEPTAEEAILQRKIKCPGCFEQIFWARTPGNRVARMRPNPVPDGRYYIAYWTARYIALGSVAVDGLPAPDEPRYDVHFCPSEPRKES